MAERFWAKVNKSEGQGPNGDCWEWTASVRKNELHRRGTFWINGKRCVAYHVAFEIANPGIERGTLFVCHRCNNSICVRPEHLYLGTNTDNMRDRKNAGHYAVGPHHRAMVSLRNSGVRHHSAHFNEKQIADIWRMYDSGMTKTQICRVFNVLDTTICNIINGKTYKELNPHLGASPPGIP